MLLTTTNTIEGKEITQYFGIVSGETIIGANVFKDFFAGIRDIVGGRAGSYESVLREAKETALKEMSDHATQLGANAVIAIDLDYETVGGSGSMLMVTAAGTAVRYPDPSRAFSTERSDHLSPPIRAPAGSWDITIRALHANLT